MRVKVGQGLAKQCVLSKKTLHGLGFIAGTFADDVARYVEDIGRLAADVIEHLTLSRLRTFEFVRIEEDGTLSPGPVSETPWVWWFHEGDLDEPARQLLSRRYAIEFTKVE